MKTIIIGMLTALIAMPLWNNRALTDEQPVKESAASDTTITIWYESWDDGMAAAKRDGKPIIVDFFTTWCGPCQGMEKEVFPEPEVRKRLEKDWVCIHIDCDNRSRNGTIDGRKMDYTNLSSYYRVHSIPTFLFFDTGGNPVQKFLGYIEKEEFCGILDYMRDEAYKKNISLKEYKLSTKGPWSVMKKGK